MPAAKVEFECQECEKVFKKVPSFEVSCPKCKGIDVLPLAFFAPKSKSAASKSASVQKVA